MTIIYTKYKGKTTNDAGLYYAPYAPISHKKWERTGIDGPTNKWVYNVRSLEVRTWIEEQPVHMWKHYDIPDASINEVSLAALLGQNYIFTEEMEAWFQLRWS
jgi:hypothetical protein